MTREEIIAYGKDYYRDLITACCEIDEKHKEFVRMAIQALEQEPCEKPMTVDEMEREYEKSKALFHKIVECDDAISREAVLNTEYQVKIINDIEYVMLSEVQMKIRKMPPVTQKSGKWIPVSERLPEENETVLINYCRLNEHSVRMAIWDELHCRFYNSEYTKYVSVDFVTAWMPLPKPYEPQESEDKE